MKTRINKTVLALGADIKSRFCIVKGGNLVLSEEFGDLSDMANFNRFKKALLKIKVHPEIVAFDMHPAYFSSRLADLFNTKNKVAVQHHHAHIASLLFAKDFKKPVIGVVFDGTGFGSDGNLWGGEFMVVDRSGFKRKAHFKYLKMPGGEVAVKEPQRMAFSILYDCFGVGLFKLDLGCLRLKPKNYYNVLLKMVKQNINSPFTSSVGRLFDAASSILGICHTVDFEAEAAIKLEKLAARSENKDFYEFDILEEGDCFIIGYNKLIRGILSDIKKGLSKQDIAKKFHNSLAEIITKIVDGIGSHYNLRDVVLSGGVFQNKILFNSVVEKLDDYGYNLVCDDKVPVNDLCICIGQAYVALHYRSQKCV